jgi:prolyl oligopeptidase
MDGTYEDDVPLPGVGWGGGFGGVRSNPKTHFLFMSFVQPPAVYSYDADRNESQSLRSPARAFDAESLETTLNFVVSKDGTRVPLFVTGARTMERDGARPTLMWGYGGFGIPIAPWFWPLAIAWMERGGVFAVPAIRGGGEYGDEWHRAGCGANKQNSFDDFIACAEWLIAQGYTDPGKLAISGASNGGLLVGACITQRPELFGAAHIDMGLLDMLHIDRVRVGLNMRDEYGSLDDPDDVERIRGYSPLHNLKPGTHYPATIITTGNHDELVIPSNSYKFAAAMQAAQASDAPVLLRVEVDTGHGVGKPTSKAIAEQSDVLTFLLNAVG